MVVAQTHFPVSNFVAEQYFLELCLVLVWVVLGPPLLHKNYHIFVITFIVGILRSDLYFI